MNRALTTALLVVASALGLVGLTGEAANAATSPAAGAAVAAPAAVEPSAVGQSDDGTDTGDTSDDDTTRPTLNEFLPEQRPLSDCLSSLPKPNCGSKARGGWSQTVVFLAVIGGLSVIAWRIIASSRRARRERDASVTTSPGEGTDRDR